jgi:hypothetical protein
VNVGRIKFARAGGGVSIDMQGAIDSVEVLAGELLF